MIINNRQIIWTHSNLFNIINRNKTIWTYLFISITQKVNCCIKSLIF